MTHVFISERAWASIDDYDLEPVLGDIMKEAFGYRTPTTQYGTWLNRLDGLTNTQYEEVVMTLMLRGYV